MQVKQRVQQRQIARLGGALAAGLREAAKTVSGLVGRDRAAQPAPAQ